MPPLLLQAPVPAPATAPQLQLVDDVIVLDAAPQWPQMLSSRRNAARNRRFRSSDDSRYANTLRPRDPRSRRNSASASYRNGRVAAIKNSDVFVRDENATVLDSHVDFCYGRSFPPAPRVSEPAGNPRKAEAAAGIEPDSEEAEKLQKLKDELACSICLDLRYEPCTVSCSHTFCRRCLIDSIRACGSRCPKCRGELNLGKQGLPLINTMSWNSIQLLFPDECTERKSAMDEEKAPQEQQQRNQSRRRPR